MDKKKKRLGDRRDGKLLRDLDSMHIIVPMLYPNRCDNEAYISEAIELEPIYEYLKKKNSEGIEFEYTIFHVILTALIKTITLRPKMNRFIANKNLYQRNEVSASFVVKKQFSDSAAEALAFIHAKDEDTIETIHNKLYEQITSCRSEAADSSTDSMNIISSLPRFLTKFVVLMCRFLDKHGWVPKSFVATDPYYSSVIISNLGSIKLKCGYHHLTNWGTNSVFCIIGEKTRAPYLREDGSTAVREIVELGLTIDERIADGYYYSKTVRLLKKLLSEPELLEAPMNEKVEY